MENIELKRFWEQVKEELIGALPASAHPWIYPLEISGYDKGVLTVVTGQSMGRDWLKKNITEETVAKFLYTNNIPDPDLLIRTGGEMRISNYLLWQIAYSEFIVVKDFWPDFGKQNLADCILEFNNRNRRYGV